MTVFAFHRHPVFTFFMNCLAEVAYRHEPITVYNNVCASLIHCASAGRFKRDSLCNYYFCLFKCNDPLDCAWACHLLSHTQHREF